MDKNNKKQNKAKLIRNNHSIKTKAGGLNFYEDVELSETGSEIPTNKSKTSLYHRSGSEVTLAPGGMIVSSTGSISESAATDKTTSVGGRQQVVVGGDDRKYVRGNEVVIVGKQLKEDRKAAELLQKGIEEIERAKIDTIKSTKGTLVLCPTCQIEYLKKNRSGTSLFNLIRRLKIPYFGFAIDTLEKIYNTLIGNALRVRTGQELLEGSCKNKGCKNGVVESPQNKIEAGNNAAIAKANEKYEQLDRYASQLKGGSATHIYSGDLTIRAGLVDNTAPSHVDSGTYHNYAFRHTKDQGDGSNFVMSGEGNAKRIINTSPHPTVGNIAMTAANKILLQSGSPGLDIITKGHANLQFGSVNIAAGEGEVAVSSNNVTVIKGKNIRIDADDRTGATGVEIKSNHTLCAGALHVNGNTTMLGSLSLDGNLCTPFLITPSMRLQTDDAGSTKTVANGAMWIGSAQVLSYADRVMQLIMRDVMPGYVLTTQGIYTIALEFFNLADITTSIEPIATGVYLGFCANAAGPGASWGFIWNFKHCHIQTPQTHAHDHTVPKGQYLSSNEAWGQVRTDGSHVPTPANAEGDGMTPGPKSSRSCGGGGLAGFGFGTPNSSASQNRIIRNANYGIIGSDAYGDYDFVNSIPSSLSGFGLTGFNIGNYTYDSDGNIQPSTNVGFSLGLNCPVDITNLIVNPDSPTIDETKC